MQIIGNINEFNLKIVIKCLEYDYENILKI
jgi:hypothetical protein